MKRKRSGSLPVAPIVPDARVLSHFPQPLWHAPPVKVGRACADPEKCFAATSSIVSRSRLSLRLELFPRPAAGQFSLAFMKGFKGVNPGRQSPLETASTFSYLTFRCLCARTCLRCICGQSEGSCEGRDGCGALFLWAMVVALVGRGSTNRSSRRARAGTLLRGCLSRTSIWLWVLRRRWVAGLMSAAARGPLSEADIWAQPSRDECSAMADVFQVTLQGFGGCRLAAASHCSCSLSVCTCVPSGGKLVCVEGGMAG